MPFENSLLKADTSVGGTISRPSAATGWQIDHHYLTPFDLYKRAKRLHH